VERGGAALNAIVSAFKEASVALGFPFEEEFVVQLPNGGTVKALGLVRRFGSPMGMLLFAAGSEPALEDASALRSLGFSSSVLYDGYGSYDRELFISTLDDWQFFGPDGERPGWYTGKAWK
jgi:hypothetical protein